MATTGCEGVGSSLLLLLCARSIEPYRKTNSIRMDQKIEFP